MAYKFNPFTGKLDTVNDSTTSLAWGFLTGTLSNQTDLQTALNAKEASITAGTSLQYWRGDKTFQTLNTAVVVESTNLYFTNARAIASTLTAYVSGAGTVSATDTILQAIQKLNGNVAALVTGVSSVNSLTGAVALTGTANRITVSAANVFDISASYVGQSSITTLGTITTGVWNGTVIVGTYGGTGVNNGTKTLTYLKNISFTSADDTGVYTLPTGTKTLVATDVATLSSLVSIGTVTTGTWNATVISAVYGGTGVANNVAMTVTGSGNFAYTRTLTGVTNVTFPTSGTLTTLAGAEELTNKTLTSSVAKGTWTASGTWTIPAVTFGGTVSGGGNNVNNVIIGAVTPLAGTFTTLTGTAGSLTGLTTFALRDTSAAFDVTIAATSGTALTAGRTLTIDMGNVAHTLVFGTSAGTLTFPTGTKTLVDTTVTTLSSLVSIGTITTGVWTGTTIAVANGGTGDTGTAWSTYTPTVTSQTGTPTTTTVTGRYKTIGKTVFAVVTVVVTTVGTAAGAMRATLPVTPAANYYSGSAIEYQITGKSGAVSLVTDFGTFMGATFADGTTMWVNTYKVIMSITYEST